MPSVNLLAETQNFTALFIDSQLVTFSGISTNDAGEFPLHENKHAYRHSILSRHAPFFH